MTRRLCPFPACDFKLHPRLFACPTHWRLLPWRYRNGILVSWRRLQAARQANQIRHENNQPLEDLTELIDNYRTAQARALAHYHELKDTRIQ